MRTLFLTITALLGLMVTAFADNGGETATPASQGPKLRIPDSTFDFGMVPQGAIISHVFWLHNIGTDTLRILKVVPG